jgi:hypothetical protein
VRQLEVRDDNFLLFVIDKTLFGLERDILYVCAYGVALLENCLIDHAIGLEDYFIVLSGDLNGRTADVSQKVSQKVPVDFDSDFDFARDSGPVNVGRCSQDKIFNGYGKVLLSMCTVLNMYILNGMCYGDREGRFTYLCDSGCSVVDYFLMSRDLFAIVCDTTFLNVLDCIETKHMPVKLLIRFPGGVFGGPRTENENVYIEKYVWDIDFVDMFQNGINSQGTYDRLQHVMNLIDIDVNLALNTFNVIIKDIAACMKKRVRADGKKKCQDWFDVECRGHRREVRKRLKVFRRTLSADDRNAYCKVRREYKNLLFRKKKVYNEMLLNKLVASVDNQYSFWDTVRSVLPKRTYVRNQISAQDWFVHFKRLLEKNELNVEDGADDVENVNEDNLLNQPISEEEVLLAMRKLKCRKAAGPDCVIGELLKYACPQIVPFFVKFFNVLFDKGIFPDNWTESIILPLFKKGDVNNPGNYRGISLCDISSKIYGTIINARLQSWVKQNNITGEYQAGFKKGYSTVDHIFTLMACVQKQFSRNRKLYVAFIDFEKAFDSINRNLLWPILLKNGIKGKLFRCVKSMYECVKARVRCGAVLTDYIRCSAGLKQGDGCSPVLFSLFINELALEVINKGRHGVTFSMDVLELFILLLADDIVLFAETVVGLQTQLNSLQHASATWNLKVNLDKSNVVVFRKGGYLGARERWFFDGNVMPVVNCYKYLGIYFSTKLSFSAACNDLASKAKRALLLIMQRLRALNNVSAKLFLKLFDAQVQSIVQYGSEIWGLDKAAQLCEKVHLFALKKFLGVELRTPNDLVYGELDRYPITVNFALNSLRYWLKLTQMEESRIPRKAYVMLYNLDERGKKNWASRIRQCLFQFGFGFVWINQGVGGVKEFLRVFKERMIDCRWQNWHEHVQDSNRFSMYRLFSTSHSVQTYLLISVDRHLKCVMTRFRFGVTDLAVHFYRYRNHTHRDLLCPLCKEAEENEVHFVLCCPFLNELRKEFIPLKYFRTPSVFRLAMLVSSKSEDVVKKLSIFLYKAFKIREVATS